MLTPLTTIHYCRSGRRTRNQESSWAQTSFLVRFPHVAGRHSSYTHTHRRTRARTHTHIHTHTRARLPSVSQLAKLLEETAHQVG